ncbi:MAG: hypothetical protein WAT93_11785, partial [Pontixanthobacter sp.]
DGVKELSPWRFAIANAVGAEIPASLMDGAGPYYQNAAATAPMLTLSQRAKGADEAARRGVLSSSSMVELYSEIHAEGADGPAKSTATQLRNAYAGQNVEDRVAAIRSIWETAKNDYSRYVLTAFAAARITPSEDVAEEDSAALVASMLSAGLDADALSWAQFAPQGGQTWALLSLSQPQRSSPVSESQIDAFIGDDESQGQRKSKFLLAGLAGLGRITPQDQASVAGNLEIDLARESKWSKLIDRAADVKNTALVAYLAGVGMQGTSWDQMTARHLYHIVAALNRVGLSAEARMIAAEAVARG